MYDMYKKRLVMNKSNLLLQKYLQKNLKLNWGIREAGDNWNLIKNDKLKKCLGLLYK